MQSDLFTGKRPLIELPEPLHVQLQDRLERLEYNIDEIKKIDQPITYELIDLEELNNKKLEQLAEYKQLKEEIQKWNDKVMEIRLGKKTNQNNLLVENYLYSSLKYNLQELAQTKFKDRQVITLQKVFKWFYDNKPKIEQKQQVQLPQASDFQEDFQFAQINDFMQKHRSFHSNIDPPEDRLINFKRKTLLSSNQSTTASRPGTSQFNIPKIETLDRPKTQGTQYKMSDQMSINSRPKTNQQQQRKMKSEVLQEPTLAPDSKVTYRDIEKVYNQQIEPSFETKGIFLTHNPMDEVEKGEEINVYKNQKQYFISRNKELKNQREDQEILERIQEWACNKSRIDEMILQKNETIQSGSKFINVGIKMSDIFGNHSRLRSLLSTEEFDEEQAYNKYLVQTAKNQQQEDQGQKSNNGYKPNPKVIDFSGVCTPTTNIHSNTFQVRVLLCNNQKDKIINFEQNSKVQKFQKLRSIRQNWLPGGGLQGDDLDNEEILRRKKMSTTTYCQSDGIKNVGGRQLSEILKKNSQKEMIKQQVKQFEKVHQIQEVAMIKNALSKNQTQVSIRKIQKSLVIPRHEIKAPLPDPGFGLLQGAPQQEQKKIGKKNKKN